MYSNHQRHYLAQWLTLSGKAEDSLTQTIASARVDMNPHQVEAAMFALASPLSNGVILADEVGLGKTIEASLILAQKWAERRRKLLLIAPATLRKQWSQELEEKFSLPSRIIEAKSFNQMIKEGCGNPFDIENATGEAAICICSYEFASRKEHELARIPWDLVVMDEAINCEISTRAMALKRPKNSVVHYLAGKKFCSPLRRFKTVSLSFMVWFPLLTHISSAIWPRLRPVILGRILTMRN